MLINFSVENFRSFGAEQTLNLIADAKMQGHEDHEVPIGDTGKKVLRTGVIYGANAAGKSNLVQAILFAQSLILGAGQMRQLASNHFRFCKKKKPSSFEFRFLVNEQLFVYGFTIGPKFVVEEEWLVATSPKRREIDVFSRKKQDITVGNLTPFGKDAVASKKALEAFLVLSPRPNQLLLHKIVELPSTSRGQLLDHVAWWFTECLSVIQPSSSYGPLLEFLGQEASFRRFAGEFLENVGTGIKELHIEEKELQADSLPKEIVDGLQMPKGHEATLLLGSSVSLELHPEDPSKVIRRHLVAKHPVDDNDYSMPFQEESDGTQRCLNLLPALYHLATGCKVFVIDELDRSLHPHLSYAFLRFFLETCPGACQQMILTTHETHLLDQELLRRDEVWFAEKDKKQQTRLYSLADLNVRNDVRLEKGYLHGRFGGIPFIGDPKKLMDLIRCPTDGTANAKKTPS